MDRLQAYLSKDSKGEPTDVDMVGYHLETIGNIKLLLKRLRTVKEVVNETDGLITHEMLDSYEHDLEKIKEFFRCYYCDCIEEEVTEENGWKKTEQPVWSLENGEQLPDDIQDVLNNATDTYVNNEGKTLKEVLDDASKTAEEFINKTMTRGFYRKPLTVNDQKDMLDNGDCVYVQGDELLTWAEREFDEGFLVSINAYDYPNEILEHTEHIPLSICGVDGNEFKEEQRVVYIKKHNIRVITGEESDILQGRLKGEGSDILYS